jgi:hypothetical protein
MLTRSNVFRYCLSNSGGKIRLGQGASEHSRIIRVFFMGVNPGGDGGTRPPSFWSGGDEYLIIPPFFDMFNEILFLGYLKT